MTVDEIGRQLVAAYEHLSAITDEDGPGVAAALGDDATHVMEARSALAAAILAWAAHIPTDELVDTQ